MKKFLSKYIYIYIYIGLCVVILVSIAYFVKINKVYKLEKKVYKLEKKNYKINNQIRTKLSMKDDIFRMGEVSFYVPNYPMDAIQREIIDRREFYEINQLHKVDGLLPEHPVILDVGANIGSHTLYWLTTSPKRAKHVYAFEVIDETFNILKKNIEINNLKSRTTIFNFGLSNVNSSARIQQKSNSFQSCCAIMEAGDGIYKFRRLDDVKIAEKKIDLVKINIYIQ